MPAAEVVVVQMIGVRPIAIEIARTRSLGDVREQYHKTSTDGVLDVTCRRSKPRVSQSLWDDLDCATAYLIYRGVTPIASLMTFLLHPSSAMICSFVCVVSGVCDLRKN